MIKCSTIQVKMSLMNFFFNYRENSYVRVYGHMKSLQDKKCLVAFKIAPVKDFNEITYHMLDVIHSFLYKTKVGYSFLWILFCKIRKNKPPLLKMKW